MLPHMLSGADAVLVSQLPEVVDIVVPSKLVTSLAAGAMIVVAAHPESEAARLVAESGAGVMIPPSDAQALAETLCELRDGAIDVSERRRRARAFGVARFGRDRVYGPICEALADGFSVSAGVPEVGANTSKASRPFATANTRTGEGLE